MPAPRECLTDADLAALHLGDLTEAELARTVAHLESCPRCEEAARALDGLSDYTLAAYRRSALAGPLPDAEALPESVGDYEILGEIGRGGMGVVYRARHRTLRRVVALKMLLGGYFADREQRQRFLAEAEAVARLQHLGIVGLFEVGEHDVGAGPPRPYFTLEYVEGGSLDRRLAGRPLPPPQAAAWLEHLARAVHYAHERGIIHRDLKPSNVLLTADGGPKVCDFGVAKLLTGSDRQTASGMILGTAEYMAPEQAEGKVTPGPACDVYALGVILYEMLAGRPPFKGATTLDTLTQHRTQEPVPVRRLQPKVPRDLETICHKCLEKEPARRYASAAALAEDLRRFLAHEPIAAKAVTPWGRLRKWARRRPAVAVLTAAVAVAVVTGLAGVGWQWRQAVSERANALRLADDLRTERDAAVWQTYRAKVAAAAGALQLHNPAAARRHLEAAPPRYRDWEWHYLAAQLDLSQAVFEGHQGIIRFLAFSPDNRRLMSCSADRTVRVWDVATGQSPIVRVHDDVVRTAALSPGGRRLACITNAGTLYLHDLAAGTEAVVARTPGTKAEFLAFSPDGTQLGVDTDDGKVALRDAATGQERLALYDPQLRRRALAFSPGGDNPRAIGKSLAVSAADGSVVLWDTANGRPGEPLRSHSTMPITGAFSPDGQRLVTAGHPPDSVLRLWRVGGAGPVYLLRGQKGQIRSVAFSPDGSRIASTSDDATACLWDGTTGAPLATLRGHSGAVGRAIFTPDGKRLVTSSEDQTLRVWDVATGECLTVLRGHVGPVRVLAVSPDGTRLASAASDTVVRLWDLRAHRGVLRGHADAVCDVAFSPDGKSLFSASADTTVIRWDAATGRPTGRFQNGAGPRLSVGLSPDGKQAVCAAARDTACRLWDLAAGESKGLLLLPPGEHAQGGCAFHRAGVLVAVGGQEGAVHLWYVTSGRHVAALRGHTGEVFDVAFSPDGRQLASAGADGTVCLWDTESRQPLAHLRGHKSRVFSVAYSPDGRLIASGGPDQTVRLWDAATRAEVASLPHDSGTTAVRFHRDGTRLAVGCSDGTIRLWDLATREEVVELRGHTNYVHALAWSPDGKRLASCSGDFTVRVWDSLPPQDRAGRR
jgi:WD40 repeat protein